MKNEESKPQDNAETEVQSAPSLESEAAELLKDWSPAIADEAPAKDEDTDDESADSVINDSKTDEAVADIVATESDEILAIEDAVNEAENTPEPKLSFGKRLKSWLGSPKGRWTIAGICAVLVVVSIVVPSIRYFILNTAGVRARSSVTVLDLFTQQPLKNTHVQIGNAQGVTDGEGAVTLSGIKLGTQRLKIEKLAFSSVDKSVTIGWGSNPQGSVELTPTGAQYEFHITDVLTEKPVSKVELTSGQSNARTDDQGRAVLTIEEPGEGTFDVQFTLDGYRTDTLAIESSTTKSTDIRLSADSKHVFISKRSGKYDMYSVYADGKQESLLLEATGSERGNDLTVVPHPSEPIVAYVSTRANQTNADGYLLSSLLLVNVNSKETTHIATTERILVVGWTGKRLVYIQISEGQSAANDQRYKLMSYDPSANNSKQLVAADYINDVKIFGGQIFYALGGGLQPQKAKLYRVNADGSNTQTILDQEIWSIVRVDVDELAFNASSQRWYAYKQGSTEVVSRAGPPTDVVSRVYIDSPDGKHAAWIDERDGKGTLIVYDFTTKTEEVVIANTGLGYPVSWLTNSALVYRTTTPSETADYVVDSTVKQPRKLADVTETHGLGAER